MSSTRHALAAAIAAVAGELGATLRPDDVAALLCAPPRSEMGDIALPCFQLARELRKAPPAIAAAIAQGLAARLPELPAVASAVAAGPYVNFRLDPAVRARAVVAASLSPSWGSSGQGDGKTVGLDFSSPNIAKPFGIGHLRSTAIGNALRNLFRALGYRVVGINHLGDWGTQFGKLMSAWTRWGDEAALDRDPIDHLYDLYVRFHREAEQDSALADEGRAWFRRLEAGDATARQLWQRFRDLSLREFERIYRRLGVEFDHYWGEAFYNEMLEPLVADVRGSGLAKESEGALVVPLDDLNLPPCLILKADGATLYATRDLAAARYRYEQLQFDQFLYVVGVTQTVHFQQVFAVLDRMGYGWAKRCHHVPFGTILGISTRKGTLVFLEDILDRGRELVRGMMADRAGFTDTEREAVAEQVAVGAILFFDLSRGRIKDYEFQWDHILRGLRPGEPGQTGPYLQYTHVRLAALEKTFCEEVGPLPTDEHVDFARLAEASERELVAAIERYPEILDQAASLYEPSVLSHYLLDLAEAFNSFYSSGARVVSSDLELSRARIALVGAVRRTLSRGLAILGVPLPERM